MSWLARIEGASHYVHRTVSELSQFQGSAGLMRGNIHMLKAANSIGFVVSFLCCEQTSLKLVRWNC